MAYEFAQADNFADLFERLLVFLTSHPALVASGQAYEKLYDETAPAAGTTIAGRAAALRAPGDGDAAPVYIGLNGYGDTASDWYNLRLYGGIGFKTGLLTRTDGDIRSAFADPGPPVQLLLWNQPMPYWFFANGRRFVIVVKVSTVFESAYAGLLKPPSPAAQYPYPLAIAGAYRGDKSVRWSDVGNLHRGISNPYEMSSFLRDPSGRWLSFSAETVSSSNGDGYGDRYLWPLAAKRHASSSYELLTGLRDFNGSYPLLPFTYCTRGNERNRQLGKLDGVFFVPMANAGSEDLLRSDGADHVVFQSGWRSENPWYFVVRIN